MSTGNTRGLGRALGLCAAALMAWCAASLSASAQQIPPTVDPGRIPQRFEPPRRPGVQPDVVVPTIPTQVPPEQARQIRFVLRAVTITGSTVYTPQQLQVHFQALLGREVSLLEVYGVANAITARYRTDGYVLSQAVVPQQQVRDGVVQIIVVEGRINRVIIRDQGQLASYNYLLQYSERLKASRPLRQEELERYLLLINDFPGMRVSGTLAPSDQPGTADLIVEVAYKRIDAYAVLDNRGSRFLGPYQGEFSAAYNGLIDTGDRILYRTVLSIFQPRELQFHEARYQIPVFDQGTIFEVWGNYSRTRPGFTLKPLDLEGEGYTVHFRLRHPILRTRAMNFWVYGGFDWIHSENEAFDVVLTDDRLRVIRYGAIFEAVDQFRGITFLQVEVSHGIDGLGARGNSREFGRTDFTKVTLDAQRNQQIWGPVSAFIQFTGQYAATQLLAPEEFGLGGRTYGRAFDPSEKTGDHGLAVAAELRYSFEPIKLPQVDAPLTLQLFGFGDWGRVYHIDERRKTFETLASAGVGVRFNIGTHLSGQVEGAVPIYGRVASLGSEGNNWRVFFVVNGRF